MSSVLSRVRAPLQDSQEVCGTCQVHGAQAAGLSVTQLGDDTRLSFTQCHLISSSPLQVNRQKVQEEELITVDAIGCFEGEEDKEVEVAGEEGGEEEGEAGSGATLQVPHGHRAGVTL